MIEKTAPSFNVEIHMAGDIIAAGAIIQKYVDAVGLCVTLTPQSFIYTGGREEGFKVGLINYPRFPKEPKEIIALAHFLAIELWPQLGQQSYSIVTPIETIWVSHRPEDTEADPARQTNLVVTDEMVASACKAFSEGWSIYPDGEAKTQVTDWFDLDAQDAVDFGVLKEPKWDGYSDIRGMQHEWYVAAVVKEPMRAALTAVLSADPARQTNMPLIKPLDWQGPTPETNGCHVARCIFGTYSAVNEQGWYVMLDDHPWGQSFEWSAPDMRMTFDDAAKAAQADYERRILSALATTEGQP